MKVINKRKIVYPTPTPIPVYDLVMQENNPCFSLESGIISHNTLPSGSPARRCLTVPDESWIWTHCLAGETLIKTSKGNFSIKELYEKFNKNEEILIYSRLNKEKIIDSVSNIVISNYVDELIELELENGKSIRCTPNHRFLMKNGEYIEAKDITEETELEEI